MSALGRRAAVLLFAGGLAGCVIGPNYERPEVADPAEYRGQVGPAEAASLADLPWWDIFSDPALQDLIGEALESNYDLRQAASRIMQAQALVGATRSEFFPQIDYGGGASRQKSALTSDPDAKSKFNVFFGVFKLAWEIDVWGRIRRGNEAARAQMLASEDFRRGVLLTLVSQVAQAYFELLEIDRQLQISRDSAQAFQETLDLFTRRFEGGVGSRLQTTRAEAALAQAAATIPDLESRIVAKENQLSILLGRAPGAIPRGVALVEQTLPPATPAGLPSALLERRPDVRQAEQSVVAANALIGISIANFFPRIGLTGLYGGASTELSDLVKGGAEIWQYAAELTGPLFRGGFLLEQYRSRVAEWEEVKLGYEQTVITALAEVSDALTFQEKLVERRAQRGRAVAALSEALRLSLVRYKQGLAGYFEVLDAQQQLFPAEQALARTVRAQLSAVVQLYRTLGGGWQLGGDWQPVSETAASDGEPADSDDESGASEDESS